MSHLSSPKYAAEKTIKNKIPQFVAFLKKLNICLCTFIRVCRVKTTIRAKSSLDIVTKTVSINAVARNMWPLVIRVLTGAYKSS